MDGQTIKKNRFPGSRRARIAAAAIGLLAVGGVGGVVTAQAMRPSVEMAPLRAVPIRSLGSDLGIITVKGRVAEVYGNKFVIDDGGAKALVDTGRAGEDGTLVATGAPVTVQGRFESGFVHASFLVDGAGHVTALAPPPHRGGRHGPPPPPAVDGAAPTFPAPASTVQQ